MVWLKRGQVLPEKRVWWRGRRWREGRGGVVVSSRENGGHANSFLVQQTSINVARLSLWSLLLFVCLSCCSYSSSNKRNLQHFQVALVLHNEHSHLPHAPCHMPDATCHLPSHPRGTIPFIKFKRGKKRENV